MGNDRTKDKVIRREAVMAGLLPGEVLDKNRIEIFRRRLMGLGYFMNDPQQGKQIKIEIVRQRPSDQPYGDLMMPLLAGRDAEPGCKTLARAIDLVPSPAPVPGGAPGTTVEPNVPGWRSVRLDPVRAAGQLAAGRGARAISREARRRPPAIPNPAARRHRRAARHGSRASPA